MPSFSLPTAAVAASAIGSAVSAYGAIRQGQAGAAAKYQAEIANQNAIIGAQNITAATQAGNVQAQAQMMRNAAQQGEIRAAIGASGIDVNRGSAVATQQGQADIGQLDVLTIRNQAARQAYGYQTQSVGFQNQAQLDTTEAGFDKTAGMIGGIGSILGGVSSIGDKYMNYKKTGALPGLTPTPSPVS